MIALAITTAVSTLLIALIGYAMLAPVETMTWWAGWSDKETNDETVEAVAADAARAAGAFIVYLAGVNVISGDALTRAEKRFLAKLGELEPGCAVVDDIFPYSPAGRPLIGKTRTFVRIWRMLAKLKLDGNKQLGHLINLRNIFQVLVSADERYGPIYNFGAADIINDGLVKAGYAKGSGVPIFIIGYSGGGQFAAGTVGYLTRLLDAPIVIISMGGVFASPPGLSSAVAIHHLRSDDDRIEQLGAIMFPQRWPIFKRSEWNRARRAGKVFIHDLPEMTHTGQGCYFGRHAAKGAGTNFTRTLECVEKVVTGELQKLKARPPAAALPEVRAPQDAECASR